MPESTPSKRTWLRPAFWAMLLFLLDGLWINQGGIAGIVLMVTWLILLPWAWLTRSDPGLRRRRFMRVAFLTLSAMAVFLLVATNNNVADRRFRMVAGACLDFHDHRGRFPERLEELVPEFLPTVPPAKILGLGRLRDFRYYNYPGRHELEYVVFPPFDRRYIILETMEVKEMD